jgi:glycerol-3-phosphate acyltransferase PlsX
MRIALDAMGGDNAPEVNLHGALEAAQAWNCEVVLVGHKERLEADLKHFNTKHLPVTIEDTPDVVEMSEAPAEACRAKPRSSIMVAAQLHAEGKVDAMVSAGNSGATMTAALMHLKRLEGVSRPAIATVLPTLEGLCVVLDMGANVDCKPKHLYQFAVMGSIYAQEVLGLPNPRVGLLSIGEEEGKGNELTVATHELLKASPLNYIGNVEGRDIPFGRVEVTTCDGFVGNVVLKFGEGMAEAVMQLMKDEIKKHPMAILSALFLKGVFKDIKKKFDYAEYGGAPLLGVNGVAVISHGKSNAKAIKNAIGVATEAVRHDINGKIRKILEESTPEPVKPAPHV